MPHMSTGQPHPGTPLVDDGLVRRLIAGQFPQWVGPAVRRWPSGGTVNAMFRLGDAMVVRLPLAEGGAGDVTREREWLPRLAPHLPVRIPEVLGAGLGFKVATEREMADALDKARANDGSFSIIQVMLARDDHSPALKRLTASLAERVKAKG